MFEIKTKLIKKNKKTKQIKGTDGTGAIAWKMAPSSPIVNCLFII